MCTEASEVWPCPPFSTENALERSEMTQSYWRGGKEGEGRTAHPQEQSVRAAEKPDSEDVF